MKRAIIKSAKVGALVGFSLAILNAILVLLSIELSWPIPDPQKVVVFTSEFISTAIPSLLIASPFWLFLPTLIGSATASIFGFILIKFNPHKQRFIFTCTILCALIAGVYFTAVLSFTGIRGYATNHFLVVISESPMIGVTLLIFPGIFYILAGFFVSRYLFHRLPNLSNVTSPSP